jgi:hypothetical protein
VFKFDIEPTFHNAVAFAAAQIRNDGLTRKALTSELPHSKYLQYAAPEVIRLLAAKQGSMQLEHLTLNYYPEVW